VKLKLLGVILEAFFNVIPNGLRDLVNLKLFKNKIPLSIN